MKFTRLQMTNFGPYFGIHEMELEVERNTPIIVVHGENMRGKTSLFNAFRWCLYGIARGREGEVLSSKDLFNSVALEEKATEASVQLHFEHDAELYVATRRILVEGDGPRQRFVSRWALQVGSTVVSQDAATRTVAAIMDEPISRFFLFDGEMLREYERLLHSQTTESDAVKDSIDSILGVPALRVLHDDLNLLAQQAYERHTKRNAADKAAAKAETEYMEAHLKLNQTETSLRKVQDTLVQLNGERKSLRKKLSTMQEAQVTVSKIEQIEALIVQDRESVLKHRARIQDLLRASWWLPVSPTIEKDLDETTIGLKEASDKEGSIRGLTERADNLRKSLDDGNCKTCGQALPEEKLRPIRELLEKTEAEIKRLSEPVSPTVRELLTRQSDLRPFSRPATAGALRATEVNMRSLEKNNRMRSTEIEELQGLLRGDESAEIRAMQAQHEQVTKDIGKAEVQSNRAKIEAEKLRSLLNTLQRRRAKGAVKGDSAAVEQASMQALSDLFGEAVAKFRTQMKEEVGVEASKEFLSLTSEKDYQGLVINDQYGLRILDEKGGVLPVRSAGAEQIVALSLIGALNKCAIRRGPVVMDTPFGRLDETHRGNILKWVPSVGEQILLLVQSGEIRDAEDLREIRHLIQAEYRIVRDGSPRKSKLAKL